MNEKTTCVNQASPTKPHAKPLSLERLVRRLAWVCFAWGVIGGWSIIGEWWPMLNQISKDQVMILFAASILMRSKTPNIRIANTDSK
jgi:hypothetical protein